MNRHPFVSIVSVIGLSVLAALTGSIAAPRILIIGDSNTEFGNIANPLRTLNIQEGGDNGIGYLPLNQDKLGVLPPDFPGFSVTNDAGWTKLDMFYPSRLTPPHWAPDGNWVESSVPGATTTIRFTGTGADIYWLAKPGGGRFSITVDGGLHSTVNTDADTACRKTVITGLASASHTITLSVVSGPVRLLGVDVRRQAVPDSLRAVLHKWGNGASTTKDFLDIHPKVLTTALREVAPNVVVILLGTNDHNIDVRPAADFKANLIALVNRIHGGYPVANILIVSTFQTDPALSDPTRLLPQYLAGAYPQAAAETGAQYWDMSTWFGPFNAARMMDGWHTNATYGAVIAQEMYNQIKQRFSTPTTAVPVITPVGGIFPDSVQVTINCATSGATIYYTTNGSDPNIASNQYTASFVLKSDATVKARAIMTGLADSPTATAAFFITITLPPQLAGYWNMDGNINDASANNHAGTLVGTPTYVAGKSGQAITLNGSTDAVTISGLDAYKSPVVSVAAWIKLTTTDVAGSDVVSMGDSYALRITSAGDVEFFIYNGTTWLYPSAAGVNIKDGAWHHIAGQKTATGLAVYVDGVLKGSSITSDAINYGLGQNLMIGKHGYNGTDYDFNGAIDDVRLYNYALTSAEIQALAGTTAINVPVLGNIFPAASAYSNPMQRAKLLGLMKNNGLRVYDLAGNVMRTADIQERGLYIIGAKSSATARKIMVIE